MAVKSERGSLKDLGALGPASWSWWCGAHTRSVLTAIFPGEPGLAGCPLILLLHLFEDPRENLMMQTVVEREL